MTLAPDHLAYTTRHETTDPAPAVSVVPDRTWKHLTLPPEDAPAKDDLVLAQDVVLSHLHLGYEVEDNWESTWARTTVDLDNPRAVPHHEAQELVEAYAHWMKINHYSTDWEPQDAEDLHNQIDRHLRAAGYTERN